MCTLIHLSSLAVDGPAHRKEVFRKQPMTGQRLKRSFAAIIEKSKEGTK